MIGKQGTVKAVAKAVIWITDRAEEAIKPDGGSAGQAGHALR